MESCQQTQDTGRLWRLIARTTGKKPRVPPNQPISFNNLQTIADQKIANSFFKRFTTTVRHTSEPAARRVRRHILRDHPLDHTFSPFTVCLVKKTIKESSNSIAAGSDGLIMLHLKHLWPRGYEELTSLNNLSIQAANIPSIWKRATILPIPKVGKPRHLGSSFRPISLLCPAIKAFERLLFLILNLSLPLAESQHGFRKMRSTTSDLLPLAHKVAVGFNQDRLPLRTTAMAIDLSKAFDTVSHTKLIAVIRANNITHNIVRWLSAYLRGRFASCRYKDATPACQAVRLVYPKAQ